jgi:hypothetical protein
MVVNISWHHFKYRAMGNGQIKYQNNTLHSSHNGSCNVVSVIYNGFLVYFLQRLNVTGGFMPITPLKS